MKYPNYFIEHKIKFDRGERCMIVGLDEVGRGALAGPVFAAAVCLHLDRPISSQANLHYEIRDSKQLTPKKRDSSFAWIKANVAAFGVGMASVEEISDNGIVPATVSAFNRAVHELQNIDPSVLIIYS